MGAQDTFSAHHGLKNVVNNVSEASVPEVVYEAKFTEKGGRQKLQPEQCSVWLMRDIASKISKLGMDM